MSQPFLGDLLGVGGQSALGQSRLGPQAKENVFRWGTVTAINPLRVILDGDTDPIPRTPYVLGAAPALGARVWCQLYARRVLVLGGNSGAAGGDPALPGVASTLQSADQTITATSRTETPTAIRCQVINAHPSKDMLVEAWAYGTLTWTAPTGGGDIFVEIAGISGYSWAHGGGQTLRVGLSTSSGAANSSYDTRAWVWVPPATTGTFGINAWKSGSTIPTYQVRGFRVVATPIRYA